MIMESNKCQEVAEEIAFVIKDSLSGSTIFDVGQITDVLRRRFNIEHEDVGRAFMLDTDMFRIYDGSTFTIPTFGILAFTGMSIMPIVPGKLFPNYDIRNKYIGYTSHGVFRRINVWTQFVDSIKRNPSSVLVSAIAAYAMIYILLNL